MKTQLMVLMLASTASYTANATQNDDTFFNYVNDVICDNPQGDLIITCNAATTTIGGSGGPLPQTGNTGTQGANELAANDAKNNTKNLDGTSRVQLDRIGLFANVQYRNLDRDDTHLENGYDGNGVVITTGADYRVSHHLLLGAAFSIGDSEIDFSHNAGSVDTKTHEWLIFGDYQFTDALYVDGYWSESNQNNDTTRSVDFGLIQYDTSSDFDTDQSQWGIGMGYLTNIEQVAFDVSFRYAVSSADIDAYEETGGDSIENLNLAYSAQTIDSDTFTIALNTAFNISLKQGVLVPYLHTAIIKEFEDDAREIRAHLVLAPNEEAFVVSTDAPDDFYGLIGSGVQMIIPNGMTVFMDAESIVSHDFLNTWRIASGIRIEL